MDGLNIQPEVPWGQPVIIGSGLGADLVLPDPFSPPSYVVPEGTPGARRVEVMGGLPPPLPIGPPPGAYDFLPRPTPQSRPQPRREQQAWQPSAPSRWPDAQPSAPQRSHAYAPAGTAYSPPRPVPVLPPRAPAGFIVRLLLLPFRLVAGVVATALVAAFLIAPWLIMSKTGLMHNSNAIGGAGAPVMLVCGLWGLANIALVFVALANLPRLLAWVVTGL